MKKLTFKYVNDGKIVSMVLENPDSYVDMMHNVMKSTPIEVLSIVEATDHEAGYAKAEESYFNQYGTANE